jgi:glutamate synthase (NADPH/NADH) small chain
LPAAQQHPRLAEADRRGAAAEAYEVSQATNTFPEICGRICPQDRLCEGNCVIEQSGHGTVTIGSVEKYITDTAWEKAGSADPPAAGAPEIVGIIGAGPAGWPRPTRCAARAAGHGL